MKLSWWDQAVLATLAYVDQFHYPLSVTEIETRLVVPLKGTHPVAIPRLVAPSQRHTRVQEALAHLQERGLVRRHKQWFMLAGSGEWVATRQERDILSQAKWREVATFIELVRWIPWIEGIAVTGSLAMNNVVPNDDCDFLVVTQPRRLWLTRLAVIMVALLKGKRRSWSGEEQNSWCFNLWLDRDHLAMPAYLRSVYGAYEVIQARWVEDRAGIEAAFRHHNKWTTTFLPYALLPISLPSASHSSEARSVRQRLAQWVGDQLEAGAYMLQHWYMKPHMTRERVGRGFAFFHPRDTKTAVTTQWHQRVKRMIGS